MGMIAVKCPNCGYGITINGRGLCRCRAYLIVSWAGMNRGLKPILRYWPNVWAFENDEWFRLEDRE